MLLYMLDRFCRLFCRHQWIRERQANGKLCQCCLKCMKRREHDMLRLIEWKLDYTPIEPAYPGEFPPPLQPMADRRAA
jgi:hypothetical protein